MLTSMHNNLEWSLYNHVPYDTTSREEYPHFGPVQDATENLNDFFDEIRDYYKQERGLYSYLDRNGNSAKRQAYQPGRGEVDALITEFKDSQHSEKSRAAMLSYLNDNSLKNVQDPEVQKIFKHMDERLKDNFPQDYDKMHGILCEQIQGHIENHFNKHADRFR